MCTRKTGKKGLGHVRASAIGEGVAPERTHAALAGEDKEGGGVETNPMVICTLIAAWGQLHK